MLNTQVTCDDCKKEFVIIEIQTTRINEGIEKNYFSCPHCHTEYPSYYTNQTIRMELADIKMFLRKFHSAQSLKKKEKIHKKITALQDRIKKEMEELRTKVNAHG
jgi:hypothetical protein